MFRFGYGLHAHAPGLGNGHIRPVIKCADNIKPTSISDLHFRRCYLHMDYTASEQYFGLDGSSEFLVCRCLSGAPRVFIVPLRRKFFNMALR